MNRELLELIVNAVTLPTMPQVVVRFLEISEDNQSDLQPLISVLKTDPGISSDLLRMTNSPLFGVTRQISSLQQAIPLLGLSRVRTLVLGRYLIKRLDAGATGLQGFSFSYYWRRALASAVLAARFADHLAPRQRDEAFIGSLLADTGVVALLQAIGRRYECIAAEYAPLHGGNFAEREQAELGLTHAEVSAMLLDKWMLPPAVVEAVRFHHAEDPLADNPRCRPLSGILNAAGRIGRMLCESPVTNEVAEASQAAQRILRVDARFLQHALQDIEAVIREFADLLGIYIVQSNVFGRISLILSAELAEMSHEQRSA